MRYPYNLVALIGSSSFAAAAPTDIKAKTFELVQEPRGSVLKNGPLQMMKTYSKYAKVDAVAPEDVKAAAAAAQSGSVTANPQAYDSSYLSPVKVAGKTLMLDFDTGSADLWVFSNLLPSSQSTGHDIYTTDNSKRLAGETWEISYGDGSGAGGVVYADTVIVGPVTATSQAVEAATSISAAFAQDENNDGLLGLAFSTINTVRPDQQITFFDTVKPTLAQAVFTADLKAGAAGSYGFGFVDSSRYTGDITYVPVNTANGFWQFTAGGYAIGGGSTGGSVGDAIADTGTTLLYLPSDIVADYYSQISGAGYDSSQGGYTFACARTLPDFTASIGGQAFTVHGGYINYAPIDNAGRTCFGGIQESTGLPFSIFGDIFLKAVFAVFDESQGAPRLGFAAQS